MRVFIANVEEVLASRQCVTGTLAQKVREISPRFALLSEFDVVVIPTAPSVGFMEYVSSLLWDAPRIFVPKGIEAGKLTIRDGFADPELRQLLAGATVESYIHDPLLKALVEECGGFYPMGTEASIAAINDKSQYAKFSRNLVDTPPGVDVKGVVNIAHEVQKRLAQEQDVMVRLVLSGGGLGNRLFSVKEWHNAHFEQIVTYLEGDQPDHWKHGLARVEKVLDLKWSPGIAFHTSSGILYDFLQITTGKDYMGAWVPCPDVVTSPKCLIDIGTALAHRIEKAGYIGAADTDLGVDREGHLYGFEINGRDDGVLHAVRATENVTGLPYVDWREAGIVIKTMDHVELQTPRSFAWVYDRLAKVNLLATRDDPTGVIITIPPSEDGVFGLLAIGNDGSYEKVEKIYRHALEVLEGENPIEDNPLLA